MKNKLKSNITNAGYLFSDNIEETLLNCSNSLEMMGYLFMRDEFEGDRKATEGVHTQLNTIKSALKYCLELLEERETQEQNSSNQLKLLLDFYARYRAVKLDDLSMCDAWLKDAPSEKVSSLSISTIEGTKEEIREKRAADLSESEHRLLKYMTSNGIVEAMDQHSAQLAIRECETSNELYKLAEEYRANESKQLEPA